jgi:hypothetical protein
VRGSWAELVVGRKRHPNWRIAIKDSREIVKFMAFFVQLLPTCRYEAALEIKALIVQYTNLVLGILA